VVEAPGKIELHECELPAPDQDEVVIKVEGSGVCASETGIWQGRAWFEYPLAPGRPGHESWGIIHDVGHAVTSLKAGDRVCSFSQAAYAEYTTAKASQCVRLPDELDGKPFPGEPIACAVNSFIRCNIQKDDTVAVVGAGFQGLLLTQLAARAGAEVTLISRRPSALQLGQCLGAQHVIPLIDYQQAINQGMHVCNDRGFDRVIEATGHQRPLDIATELTRVRGNLIIVGYHQDPRSVNMQQWNWRGIDVINAHERDQRKYVEGLWDAIEAVVEGQLTIEPLLTHTFSLHELDHALNMALERPEGFIKGIVIP